MPKTAKKIEWTIFTNTNDNTSLKTLGGKTQVMKMRRINATITGIPERRKTLSIYVRMFNSQIFLAK